MSNRLFTIVFLLLISVIVLSSTLFVVRETERGVMLKFGELVDADLKPGLHWKIPLVHEVRKFDARILTIDAPAEKFLTIEKKGVEVDSYAKWRIKDVGRYYTATNGEESRAARLVAQRINEGLRNEFAQRTLHEVVSGERDQLMVDIRNKLNEFSTESLGIEIVDVRVKKIDLPEQVSDSVFRRMTAEREREAREHRSKGKEQAEVIRADADRQRTILEAEAYREAELVRGEGDAKASAIYADAYTKDEEFYTFVRSLSAYRASFGDKGDVMLVDPESDFFRYLKDSKGGQ